MAKSFRVAASLCDHDIFVYRLLDSSGSFHDLSAKFADIQDRISVISDTRITPFIKILYLINAYCERNSAIGSYSDVKTMIGNSLGCRS